MKKVIIAAALIMACGLFAQAQPDRPRLAVLPFEGPDGDEIARLLSARPEVLSAFEVVRLGEGALGAAAEIGARMGAFADSDLLAYVGRMAGADYVLWGYVRGLWDGRLVVAAAICAASLELAAGYHRAFAATEDIPGFLPLMSWSLVYRILARPAPGSLPAMAISPDAAAPYAGEIGFRGFACAGEPSAEDAQTLAQILAIEIAHSGAYAVLPRASAMSAALREREDRAVAARVADLERLLGTIVWILDIRDEEILAALDARDRSPAERLGALERAAYEIAGVLGEPGGYGRDHTAAVAMEAARAAGADFALLAETRGGEDSAAVVARVMRGADGESDRGAMGSYGAMLDGVRLMAHVAALLTGREARAVGPMPAAPARILPFLPPPPPGGRMAVPMLEDPARFWSVGASAGTSFADPWLIGSLHGTVAPLPFSFARVGLDSGFITGIDGAGYFSMHPFVLLAFFYPFEFLPVPLALGGAYAGIGAGVHIARYSFGGYIETATTPTMDFTVGVNIGDRLDVSYTLRTNFALFSSKLSVGFTHRFRARAR